MVKQPSSKKEQILDAALRLVALHNSFNITVRQIAQEAGVNVAAINYYFKSKKEMMREMESLFMENLYDAFVPLQDTSLTDNEKLRLWIEKAIYYAQRYPGILVFLKDKLGNLEGNDFENTLRDELIKSFAGLKALLIDTVCPKQEEEDLLILALGGVILLPFISEIPDLGYPKSKEEHIQYVLKILDKFSTK